METAANNHANAEIAPPIRHICNQNTGNLHRIRRKCTGFYRFQPRKRRNKHHNRRNTMNFNRNHQSKPLHRTTFSPQSHIIFATFATKIQETCTAFAENAQDFADFNVANARNEHRNRRNTMNFNRNHKSKPPYCTTLSQ